MKIKKVSLNKRNFIIGGVLIGAMLIFTGCGQADISVKTYEKDNDVEIQGMNEIAKKEDVVTNQEKEQAKDESKNESKNESQNENKTTNIQKKDSVTAFGSNDLKLSGITFGSGAEEVVNVFGANFESNQYEEGATGNFISELSYDNGLVVAVITSGEDGIVYWFKITKGTQLKTARGIKIGDTRYDIEKAYPDNSILENSDENVVVGYPNDDNDYYSNGRIYFRMDGNVVTGIAYYNTYAE